VQIGGGIVRRRLPDGRAVLFERWGVGAALGGEAWNLRLESDPESPATGAPLIVVLALLLGYDLLPSTWPWWLYALADEVEAAFAVVERARAP
jgi:hypothetical protein